MRIPLLLFEAAPKLQVWNSSLEFKGKSGHLTALSKRLFQNQPGFETASDTQEPARAGRFILSI
jgi:hypothetical protein